MRVSYLSHIRPDEEAIECNKSIEPEGERLREELTTWIKKNRIVSILMDTAEHSVNIDIAKLPPSMKPILTHWGSIYVVNEEEADAVKTPHLRTLEFNPSLLI